MSKYRYQFAKVWDLLTAPSATLRDIGDQRSARLAASFLLIVLVLDLIGALARTPRLGWIGGFSGGLGLSLCSTTLAYPLTRTKWFRAAVFIFSISFAATAYYSILSEGILADQGTILLIYIPISLIIASSFLSAWTVFLLTGLNVGAYLFISSYGAYPSANINAQVGVITLIGFVLIALSNFQTNLEKSRLMDLQKINQHLKSISSQLEQQVAELERFTYTVSHDLRSPLVTIRGFLGMLEKDVQEQQVEKATHDMERIANATDKMDLLLTDLLELSRIGRIINPPEEIDLAELIKESLETVDGRIRAKNITILVAPDLPTLYADRIRLREVLENLIDNAAKYTGNQPNPIIEVGTRSQAGEQVIYVKDNGLGIEPQYLTKIFGLFEKLDPGSEGTGIGLALIKRIVEIHEGKIWVESDGLGKGSTFCFTIPYDKNG